MYLYNTDTSVLHAYHKKAKSIQAEWQGNDTHIPYNFTFF